MTGSLDRRAFLWSLAAAGARSARELDATTVAGYMRSQGASDTWLDWFFAQEGRIARFDAAAALGAWVSNS